LDPAGSGALRLLTARVLNPELANFNNFLLSLIATYLSVHNQVVGKQHAKTISRIFWINPQTLNPWSGLSRVVPSAVSVTAGLWFQTKVASIEFLNENCV
jgi:hypothetical protein